MAHTIPPPVIWAQRSGIIYLTINLEDCKDPAIKLEDTKLYFKGKGGPENTDHEVVIEFFKEIDPEESKYVVLPRHIPMIIKKKGQGEFWPRLLKEKQKVHWLKTDFMKWVDEDDSDADEKKDMDLEDMMKSMGNFNADAPEGYDNEPDSDDDELPDLE